MTEIIEKFAKNRINISELEKEVLRNDLSSFIAKSFNTINPSVKYNHNWHIDLIAEYLKAVYNDNNSKVQQLKFGLNRCIH